MAKTLTELLDAQADKTFYVDGLSGSKFNSADSVLTGASQANVDTYNSSAGRWEFSFVDSREFTLEPLAMDITVTVTTTDAVNQAVIVAIMPDLSEIVLFTINTPPASTVTKVLNIYQKIIEQGTYNPMDLTSITIKATQNALTATDAVDVSTDWSALTATCALP